MIDITKFDQLFLRLQQKNDCYRFMLYNTTVHITNLPLRSDTLACIL